MKPIHHFVILMLTIAMLALAISLSTTKSVQASPPSQAVEERMRATLEDANQSLGGDFKWTEEGPGAYIMDRPPKKIGTMPGGGSDPVFLHERMIIGFGDGFSTCESESSYENSSTFHGMQACLSRKPHYLNQGYFIGLSWQPQDGLEFNGARLYFFASSGLNPTCAGYDAETEASCGNWSKSTRPILLAEAMHQAAIKNGLYEPMPEEILPAPPEEILPVEPGEVVPGQPGVPTGQPVPTETGGIFGIPAAIIFGSLGIPIAGALAGAVVSSLVSLLGSSSPIPVAVPEPVKVNDLYWSERPWDVAGPGYVSKEEYEQTKNMLEQGYKWTNGGWQTPDQINESNQLQQNNQAAVAREDAEWQMKMEGERQALEQNAAELKNAAEELQAPSNMIDMKNDFEAINQELLDQNIYVVNPLQGDPTLIIDGLSKVANIGWDITTGWVTPSNGLTCGDYVGETLGKVKRIVSEKYGSGAQVQGVIFEEKSTRNPQGVLDWFDKLNDDNHNLIKVTLPDGSEWAVDFHQHNTGNKPPILRPWNEAKKVWQDYLGDEFMERISVQ